MMMFPGVFLFIRSVCLIGRPIIAETVAERHETVAEVDVLNWDIADIRQQPYVVMRKVPESPHTETRELQTDFGCRILGDAEDGNDRLVLSAKTVELLH